MAPKREIKGSKGSNIRRRNSESNRLNVSKAKKNKENFSYFIHKVLKQAHPNISISSRAMIIMNSFVNDLFERLATEASRLAKMNKRSTISSREIHTATRLLIPGELAKHAISEGTKAVTKYNGSL